jgi:hypothetical protein
VAVPLAAHKIDCLAVVDLEQVAPLQYQVVHIEEKAVIPLALAHKHLALLLLPVAHILEYLPVVALRLPVLALAFQCQFRLPVQAVEKLLVPPIPAAWEVIPALLVS